MRKYRLIEHTADIGLIAYGNNIPEAFANAAYGLFSIITDLRTVRSKEFRSIEISENDSEALLFEWLNYLLYVFDVEMLIFKKFEMKYFDEKKLIAVCYGEKYDPGRHQLRLGVKAATYHMMKIDREHNRVSVIFDV
jgi:SHS2 domain-containing protein